MARIRTIKPSFFKSDDVACLSYRARLTWVGLWLYADDDGRYIHDARIVKGDLWLFEDDVTVEMVADALRELVDAGRILTYEVDGKSYLEVVNFARHQVINKRSKSTYPDPPWRENHPPLRERSGRATGVVPEGSAPEGEGEGEREVEVEKEVEGEKPPPRKCPNHIHDTTSPPCGACRDARLTREDWDKVHPSDSKYDRAMSVIELGRSVDRARGVTRPPRAREITGMCPKHAEYPGNPCDLCKRIEAEERDAA